MHSRSQLVPKGRKKVQGELSELTTTAARHGEKRRLSATRNRADKSRHIALMMMSMDRPQVSVETLVLLAAALPICLALAVVVPFSLGFSGRPFFALGCTTSSLGWLACFGVHRGCRCYAVSVNGTREWPWTRHVHRQLVLNIPKKVGEGDVISLADACRLRASVDATDAQRFPKRFQFSQSSPEQAEDAPRPRPTPPAFPPIPE